MDLGAVEANNRTRSIASIADELEGFKMLESSLQDLRAKDNLLLYPLTTEDVGHLLNPPLRNA